MPVSYQQIQSILKDFGYVASSQKWSHIKRRKWTDTILTPYHKELKPWTAHAILKDIASQNNDSHQDIIQTYGLKI